MSVLRLTLICAYQKQGGAIKILYGALGYTMDDKKRFVLTAASVPTPISQLQVLPSNYLVALYGFRDALEEISRRRMDARTMRADFRQLDFDVDVGEIVMDLIDREKLRSAKFVNVRRMKASLQGEIRQQFADYLKKDGGATDEALGRQNTITHRPDLFIRLLNDDPDFAGIDVLVVPVADEAAHGKMRQVALVRSSAHIGNLVQDTQEDYLVLPQGFGRSLSSNNAKIGSKAKNPLA